MTSQLWHWQASNTTVIAFGQADGLSDDAAQSHCLCDHQKHRQVPIGYNKQMARKQYVKDDDTKHMSEKGSWKSAQLRNDPRQISRQKRHLHPHRPGGGAGVPSSIVFFRDSSECHGDTEMKLGMPEFWFKPDLLTPTAIFGSFQVTDFWRHKQTFAKLGSAYNALYRGEGALHCPPTNSETTGPIVKIQTASDSPGKTVERNIISLTSRSPVTSQFSVKIIMILAC